MKKGSNKQKFGKNESAAIFVIPGFGYGCFMWVMLLLLLMGCVKTKPIVTYQPLQEKTFQARAQTASISQKSAKTLIQEGFVKIGSLNVNILEKVCRHYFVGGQDISEKCTTFPYSDPTPLLLEQGQQVGGDLVVIEFEKPYTEIMNMMAQDGYYRKEFSAITAAVWREDG
jgi:hypothetical protein